MFVLGVWGVVIAVGLTALVLLATRRYLAAAVLSSVPTVAGAILFTLILYWRRFSVFSVIEAMTYNVWMMLLPGVPLALGLVVLLLAIRGYRKQRRSALMVA